MKYFLTGGGDQEHFRELDQLFINELPNMAKILIFPMACDEDDYEDVYERILGAFSDKKILKFDLCREISKINVEYLCEYDALMFEGGNTFRLIKLLRESSFFKYLKVYCNRDKIIYADSAGAIILGKDVQTAFLGEEGDEDHHKLQDYRGLGLLNDWSIHCHFEANDLDQIQELIYTTGSPIICLTEETGIYLQTTETPELVSIFSDSYATVVNFSGVHKLAKHKTYLLDH